MKLMANTKKSSAETKKPTEIPKKAPTNPNRKVKEYNLASLKRTLDKEEKKQFDDLSKEDQKKFIIKKWVEENRYLGTAESHEISLDDQQFAGLIPTEEAF